MQRFSDGECPAWPGSAGLIFRTWPEADHFSCFLCHYSNPKYLVWIIAINYILVFLSLFPLPSVLNININELMKLSDFSFHSQE